MSSVQSRVLLIRKKTMTFWGTQMNKECYNILPYWHYFPKSANHLWWKSWHRRKGKYKENYSFLYVLSYSLVSWRKRVLVECICVKKWHKASWVSFVLCLHYSSKNDIHLDVWTTKYKLYDFGNSKCDLNVFIFLFETGIVQ